MPEPNQSEPSPVGSRDSRENPISASQIWRWRIPLVVLPWAALALIVHYTSGAVYGALFYVCFLLPIELLAFLGSLFGIQTNSGMIALLYAVGAIAAVLLVAGLFLLRRWFWKVRFHIMGLILLGIWIYVRIFVLGIPFIRDYSPDGKYYLQYYRYPMFYSSIGGGSDFSGRITLKTRWGRPLATAPFGIYGGLPEPEWKSERVSMTCEFEWDYSGNGTTWEE